MAIYHLAVKTISRGKGQSAVASSAYRSGEKLYDKRYEQTKNFTNKKGIAYSEIQLPSEAPLDYLDRETLWNAVEHAEKQSNARLAREVEVALPKELSLNQHKRLLHSYIQENFVSKGMCADWSIHDKNDGNPHAHIMLTVRSIKKNGSWAPKRKSSYRLDDSGNKIPIIDPTTGKQKIGSRNAKQWERESVSYNNWNDKENVELWRKNWAKACNKLLGQAKKIDHRSYERQGRIQIPTKHEGYYARKLESKKAGASEIVSYNKKVREHNRYLQFLLLEWQKVQEMITKLKQQIQKQKNLEQERIDDILRRAKRAITDSRKANTTVRETDSKDQRSAGTDTKTLIRETRAKQRDLEVKRQFAEAEREKREAKQSGSNPSRKQKTKKKHASPTTRNKGISR